MKKSDYKGLTPQEFGKALADEYAQEMRLVIQQFQRKRNAEAKYRALIPIVRNVARAHGYAIGEHGSMRRDCDLIAVPWIDEPSDVQTLVEAIRVAISGHIHYGRDGREPTIKPHGRLAYSIHFGTRLYIDLSVIPPHSMWQRIIDNENKQAASENIAR